MSEAFDVAQSALVVIDMQNDFLAEGGAYPRRHCDAGQLSQAVAWLARAAREQGRAIVWVSSVYGELAGDTEALRGQTHVGGPCCVRASWGAEPFAPLGETMAEGAGRPTEWRVEKRWYSAFRETGLDERLRAAGVTRLVLAGVATNVCVLATARDALGLGYEVEIVADATAAGTASKHARALAEIEALGGRIRRWGELLGEGVALQVGGIGAGGSALWCGALGGVLADDAFGAVEREVAWGAMSHRGGEVPRLVAVQGERSADGVEPLYRHPVDEQPALADFTPAVDAIRRQVERRVGHPLNHCLLQLYRGGRDWISEHSDKTLDVARPSNIINVSLGRMRTMVLKPKREAGGAGVQKLPLPHGSFLTMDLATNRDYYHAIRQEGEGGGPRISLTFRHIGTFFHPPSGAVWGVGAPAAGRIEAEARARARAALAPEAREAAERAEAEQMLRLFRQENIDPGFDAASYRPGFEAINFRTLRQGAA